MFKNKKRLKLVHILTTTSIGIILTLLVMLYANDYSYIGFLNGLFVSGFLLFTLGWFLFISNENVFDLILYGVQSFWLNMFGKRKDKSYIEHITEKPKIASYAYQALWISSIPFIFVSLILTLM
jgi:hypothetical protein